MEDWNRLCMGCMREKPGTGVCPYCHFSIENYDPPMYHLKPQTIVAGKYLVGKSIGEGGFGITYIGWDLNLEIPLAIKEYFPNGFAIRDYHTSDHVTAFTGEKEKFYRAGREKFVQEAKSLAKFYKQEEIVLVRDYFQENGTAYIVMEYIVGKSYNDILKERERNHTHPSASEVFETMKPVIKALEMVHNEGIIHRDISPDNIMITEDGVAKLIDFGAARGFSDGEKSFSIVLKAGYAPEEQYRTRGHQGPWTDVYALCATMYREITGMKPPDSMERLAEDTMKKPSELGVQIDEKLEKALMKGLAVRKENRWQNMRELYHAFYEQTKETVPQPQPAPERKPISTPQPAPKPSPKRPQQSEEKQSNTKILLSVVGVSIVVVIALASLLSQNSSQNRESQSVVSGEQETDKTLEEKEDIKNTESSKSKKLGIDVSIGDIVTFGKEDRDWIVLDKKLDKVLLLSKESVGEKPYNEEREEITWEDCTLRYWLNNDYYNTAFTKEEKARICETTVKNADNPEYRTVGGNDTKDKVFLLSLDEAERYFKDDEARNIGCGWWLRSLGDISNYGRLATGVDDGYINAHGSNIECEEAVRPALWVNLESLQNRESQSVVSGEQETDKTLEEKEDVKKTESSEKQEKTESSKSKELGTDVSIGDIVTFGKEDRDWIVLDKELDKALLLSKESIGKKTYHEDNKNINWEDCTLRQWLNNDYYNTAFTKEEKTRICDTTVLNVGNAVGIGFTDAGNNTKDKIFLLSLDEAERYFEDDEARAIGSWWWLRSPGGSGRLAAEVYSDGDILEYGNLVNTERAVRPALWVNLES